MKRGVYREYDYGFGQTMLTLRSALGLTQTGLAAALGVSRQSVAEWEGGSKYPKAKHLQAFITLAAQHQAFPPGQEVDAIRTLWKSSRQKILLDETWLANLLLLQPDQRSRHAVLAPAKANTRFHWEDALAVESFYGREWELNLLTEWVMKQQCRVVTILGLGGIGKSALTVHLMHKVAEDFEVVIWRSLRDLPSCDVLFANLLQLLVPHVLVEVGDSLDELMKLLMEQLRTRRILLVLDNLESVLEEGAISGRMRMGYEGFGRFLRLCAETQHHSSILLTSRQKPDELMQYEDNHSSVRTLRLIALDAAACEQLLIKREVAGSPCQRTQLIQTYGGNPLALKIVAQTIVDLFGGEIAPFFDQGGMIFGGIHQLLHDQYKRLSPLERRVAFWLAITREPVTFNKLQSLFVVPLPASTALETMNGLYHHSLIERGQAPGSFTLQSVVLEYLTEQLINEAHDEILQGDLNILLQHGLEQAQVKDYIRRIQTHLLITPLLLRLQSMGSSDIELRLYKLLDQLREIPAEMQGYGPANIIALLRELRGQLNTLDLSRLALREVHLQGLNMQDVRLTDATIRDCVFTETFDGINTFTLSTDGQYWAASSQSGEVRLWGAGGHILWRLWPNTTDIIYRIALSPDGQKLVGGTASGIIKAWDTASGTLLWTRNWPQNVSIIYQLAFSPDGTILLVRANDEQIRLLKASNGAQLQIIPNHQPTPAIWNRAGNIIAVGDKEGVIRLWAINQADKTAPAVCIQEILAYKGPVGRLGFLQDENVLVSSGSDEIGKFWNLTNGQLIQTLDRDVGALWVSPDGNTLAIYGGTALNIVGRERVVWLWDLTQSNYIAALQHAAGVRNAIFTPHGKTIITISDDGVIQVWDVKTGECLRVMRGLTAAFVQLDWSPDGQQLAVGGTDHTVTIFSLDNNVPPRILHGHDHIVYSIGWGPDGQYLASGQRGHLRLWDTLSGECLWVQLPPTLPEFHSTFYDLAWRPDGQRLAVGTDSYGIMIWDIQLQQFIKLPDQFPTIVGRSIAWKRDGTHVAATGENLVIYVWNADGELVRQLVGHQSPLENIDWSSEDSPLVSVSTSEIIFWDVEHGKLLARIENRSQGFICVIRITSEKVITGSIDGILRWWDISTGQCLFEVDAHQGVIVSLKRSPENTSFASCGDDGTVMIWDLQTGEHLRKLRRDRPYERMDITGIKGLTEAQRITLRQLGAIEHNSVANPRHTLG